VVAGSLIASSALACTIPVFRYALDRWQADPYTLVIPESLAKDRALNDLLRPIRANQPGNLEVRTESGNDFDAPTLLFPDRGGRVWSGDLHPSALSALLDSPARKQVREKILAGASAVWVLVDDGDDAGEAEAKRIRGRLKFLEQVASLPIQDPNDPDSQLGPGPELKLEFELVRVRRNDARESAFVEMLRGPSPDPVTATKPFVSAIFGRGRTLGAWTAERIDNVALEDASMFLTGRCSCNVKQQNPGWDLLFSNDWDADLQKVELRTEKEEPETKPLSAPVATKTPPAPTKTTPAAKPLANAEPVEVTAHPKPLVSEIPLPKADPLRIGLFSFAGFCALVVLIKIIRPRPTSSGDRPSHLE
jgi:hypothetical protein